MKALGGAPGQSQEHLHLWAFPPSSAPLPPPLSVLPLQKCVPTFRGGGGRLAGLGWAGLWRGASRIVDIPGPAALCAPIL